MNPLREALRAAHSPMRAAALAAPRRRVLVAGGAGALGAAVLERLLARPEFAQVVVLVTQPLATALRGLATLSASALEEPAAPGPAEDTAVIVFDRERHANGRELAFLRPAPQHLLDLATALHRRGVRRLLIVLPHAPASLPEALKHGLVNMDEHAVAALGFEQLVIVRPAQLRHTHASASRAQRLADWVLSQLQLMIPQREQPVRAQKVAQLVAALAAQLYEAPPGTRVVPPEIVWLAAQSREVDPLVHDWLHGRALAHARAVPMRM